MRVNPNIRGHDYNFGEPDIPKFAERIECAGYDNKRMSPDYSPRDSRPFLTACRDRNCPADRCLEMSDSDMWFGTYGLKVCPRCNKPEEFCSCEEDSLSNGTVEKNDSPAASGAGDVWRGGPSLTGAFKSLDTESTVPPVRPSAGPSESASTSE